MKTTVQGSDQRIGINFGFDVAASTVYFAG